MYCVLIDTHTKSFYMEKEQIKFYAYSDPELYEEEKAGVKLVVTDMEDYQEFMTFLFNSGFVNGYLDDKPVRIAKKDVIYYKQNANEVIYSQYLLTKDQRFLQIIKKSNLFTLCRLNNEKGSVLFPTVALDGGELAILAYTDVSRIPEEMFTKYEGWKIVRMTFDAPCIVNGKFVAA